MQIVQVDQDPTPECCEASHIYTCNWEIDFEEIGIGEQVVSRVYEVFHNLEVVFEPHNPPEKKKLVYISPRANDAWRQTLRLIAVFNLIIDYELTICCEPSSIPSLKKFSNQHIHFTGFEKEQESKLVVQAYCVLSYGPSVLQFVNSGIRTVVVGPKGYGGLVTPHTIEYFLEQGFMGRCGGFKNEPLPPSLLFEDLGKALCIDTFETDQIVLIEKIKASGKMPLQASPGNEEQTSIPEIDRLISRNLQAVLASNIILLKKKGKLVVQRKATNDVIVILEPPFSEWLQPVNGVLNVPQLLALAGDRKTSCLKFIQQLLEQKVIYVHGVPDQP
jgi:hypothetical protein